MRRLNHFNVQANKYRQPAIALVLAAVVGTVGVFSLINSHATTPTATAEIESGTVSSAAATVNDNTAANGKAIKFGSTSSNRSCPPLPAYPDAACTGVPSGISLKRVPQDVTSGNCWHWDTTYDFIRIDCAGATLSDLDVSTEITNYSDLGNMRIENSLIRCTGVTSTFCVNAGPNSTVTDTEIGGGLDGVTYEATSGLWVGGSNSHNLVQRVNIHHVVHGLHIDGGSTLVDSYIHAMPAGDTQNGLQDAHTNGIFSSTGGNVVIDHNQFYGCGNNSCDFVQDYDNTSEGIFNYVVENNLFVNVTHNGEDNAYGVGIENKAIRGAGTITVQGNVFSHGWNVAPIEAPAGSNVTGNKYQDGSSADGDTNFVPIAF